MAREIAREELLELDSLPPREAAALLQKYGLRLRQNAAGEWKVRGPVNLLPAPVSRVLRRRAAELGAVLAGELDPWQ